MFGWNQEFEYFFGITSTHHHHHHLPCTTTTCHIQTPFTMYHLTPTNYIQQQSHTTSTMYNRYNLPCTNNNTYHVSLLLPTHITTMYKSHHMPNTTYHVQAPPYIISTTSTMYHQHCLHHIAPCTTTTKYQ